MAESVTLIYEELKQHRAAGLSWDAIGKPLGLIGESVRRAFDKKADTVVRPRKKRPASVISEAPGREMILYKEVKAARAAGERTVSIAARYGVSNGPIERVLKTKRDQPLIRRAKGTERKNGRVDGVTALAVVNQALALATPEQAVYSAAQAFAEQMREAGIRRLVIDLDRASVELTSVETFPLAAGAR